MSSLLSNQTLIACAVSWTVAQFSKVIIHLVTAHRLDLRLWTSAGGMPSSHSALVAALATAIGIQDGLDSPLFAVSVVLAMVVMYDAAGVRRAASAQARILNQILDELFHGHPLREERLRELLGHTPFQVVVGAAMGVVLTWLWMR